MIFCSLACAKCLSNHPGGLSCKLEGILESPVIDGYRNKCEFSVGHSLAGKKTVGFMLGNFRLVCCFLFLFFFFVHWSSSINDWYNKISGKVWLLLRNLWTAQMFPQCPVNMLWYSKIFCSYHAYPRGTELIIQGFGANSQYALAKHLNLHRMLLFLFPFEILHS